MTVSLITLGIIAALAIIALLGLAWLAYVNAEIALATEKRDLLPEHPAAWECLQGYAPLPQRIQQMPPDIVRQQFHDRLLQLLATTHRARAA